MGWIVVWMGCLSSGISDPCQTSWQELDWSDESLGAQGSVRESAASLDTLRVDLFFPDPVYAPRVGTLESLTLDITPRFELSPSRLLSERKVEAQCTDRDAVPVDYALRSDQGEIQAVLSAENPWNGGVVDLVDDGSVHVNMYASGAHLTLDDSYLEQAPDAQDWLLAMEGEVQSGGSFSLAVKWVEDSFVDTRFMLLGHWLPAETP